MTALVWPHRGPDDAGSIAPRPCLKLNSVSNVEQSGCCQLSSPGCSQLDGCRLNVPALGWFQCYYQNAPHHLLWYRPASSNLTGISLRASLVYSRLEPDWVEMDRFLSFASHRDLILLILVWFLDLHHNNRTYP
jgi:hypothetical protein